MSECSRVATCTTYKIHETVVLVVILEDGSVFERSGSCGDWEKMTPVPDTIMGETSSDDE